MRRKFVFFFLGIVAIPIAAYIGFPWYAKPLLDSVFNDKNIAIETLRLDRPAWNSIAIHELTLNRTGTGQISVVDADIQFSKLFREYRIQIKEVNAVLSFAEDIDTQEKSPLLTEFLPENFLPGIPAVDLTVQTINIGQLRDNQSVLLAQLKNTHLTNASDNVDLNAILMGEDQYAVAFSVTRDNKFEIEINSASLEKSRLHLTGFISTTPKDITLTSAVDINIEQPVYFNSRLDETLGGFVGLVKSELELELGNQPLDEILSHPLVNARGFFETALENPARGIKLETATAFELNLNKTDWKVNLATLPDNESDFLKLEMTYDNKQHVGSVILPNPIAISGTVGSNKAISAGAESVVALSYMVDDASIASIQLSDINWNGFLPGNEQFNASANADIKANTKNLMALTNIGNVELNNSSFRFLAGIELQKDAIKLNIKDKSTLLAEEVISSNVVINAVDITIPPQELLFDFERISTSSMSFTLRANTLISNDYRISSLRVNGEAQLTKSQARFRLATQTAGLRKGSKGDANKIPPYQLKGELHLPESTLTNVNLQLLNQCGKHLLSVKWVPSGLLTVTAEHTFSEHDSLRRWLNLQDLTADIPKGTLAASLDWDTNKANAPPRINVTLNQANIVGSLGTFDHVQLSLSTLEAKSNVKYLLEASADSMNIGAEVTNLILRSDFTPAKAGLTARIHEVSGKLLGGRAYIENQQWTLGQISTIEVHLKDLELAELVKTQNIESITTTGNLTGVVPIKLGKDGGFSLANGKLSDIDGGTIRYQSALAESGGLNDQLQLTLDVLKNFKYDVLDTLVQYNDGNLVLKSNILGSNPDVAGGQKIDLNLNTEVNLKSAFQAMRLQAGLEAQVEKLFGAGEESSLPFCQQPL